MNGQPSVGPVESDWRDWHVRDIETGKDLEDVITWTKFTGVSWAHDASGFYFKL